MIPVLVALWLTFQVGAIVGYLICDHHPRQRRYPTLPPGTVQVVREGVTYTKRAPQRQAA